MYSLKKQETLSDAEMQPQTKLQAQNPTRLEVYRNAALNIPAAPAAVYIPYDTIVNDVLNEWEGAPNYRFRPKRAGFYLITAELSIGLNAGEWAAFVVVQNVGTELGWDTRYKAVGDTSTPHLEVTTMRYLTPNDYIRTYAFWAAGVGNRAAGTFRQNNYLCIVRIN